MKSRLAQLRTDVSIGTALIVASLCLVVAGVIVQVNPTTNQQQSEVSRNAP